MRVIEYRTFRNGDPPHIADTWARATLGPWTMFPLTSALLEDRVFSRTYFDPQGLFVATEDGKIVGFAHAARGLDSSGSGLSLTEGTTLLVIVEPHQDREGIADELLRRCERFLIDRGVSVLFGGGDASRRCFYFGLYGGADLPGILDSLPDMKNLFLRAGYSESKRISILSRSIIGYRPKVDRLQIAIKRKTQLKSFDMPAFRTWWEAASLSGIGLRRYELFNASAELLGACTIWDMQPYSSSRATAVAGLLSVDIMGTRRREGLAYYLVAWAMHDLAAQGVAQIETQSPCCNAAAMHLFEKLGFIELERGTVFRKEIAS